MVGVCRGYVVGGCRGYVVGEIKIKANSAQLELELSLSLATIIEDQKHPNGTEVCLLSFLRTDKIDRY